MANEVWRPRNNRSDFLQNVSFFRDGLAVIDKDQSSQTIDTRIINLRLSQGAEEYQRCHPSGVDFKGFECGLCAPKLHLGYEARRMRGRGLRINLDPTGDLECQPYSHAHGDRFLSKSFTSGTDGVLSKK